jgi:small ligand-binding sensory domain FIST
MTDQAKQFSTATSLRDDWRRSADDLAEQLGKAQGGLGILYTAEPLVPHLDAMLAVLRERTGVADWVSAAGYGVIGSTGEYYGETGATALVLDIPEAGYRLFAGDADTGSALALAEAAWITDAAMPLAITHVDPRHPDAMRAVERFAASTGSFLVGGLTAAAGEHPHQAGGETGCLSGVAISPTLTEVATALSQGCTPLGAAHTVTRAENNVLIELDGRPALDVFIDDIGPDLADDLQSCAGVIFAARPVAGSDTADYTVRNLVGIDPQSKVIAIAEVIPEGDPVLFCRRDRETAVLDLRRMAEDLKTRVAGRPIRGGLYISCAARGPNQFAAPERETDIIRETLGDFPIAGFFANGELSHDRVYAYTGVLTLFL